MNDHKWGGESFKQLFNKLRELKQSVPEPEFREFLLLRDPYCDRTFLNWLVKFQSFETVFDFLTLEFDPDFVREFLLTANVSFSVQGSIGEFKKTIDLLKINFDAEFVKEALMQTIFLKKNFLLYFEFYSASRNSRDLLEIFDLIFEACGADFELFRNLFYSVPRSSDQTFFMKLKQNYNDDELQSVVDWIERKLGHDFL